MTQKIAIVRILYLAITTMKDQSQTPILKLRNSRNGNDNTGLLINSFFNFQNVTRQKIPINPKCYLRATHSYS